jgi:hypothetical protein
MSHRCSTYINGLLDDVFQFLPNGELHSNICKQGRLHFLNTSLLVVSAGIHLCEGHDSPQRSHYEI